MGQTVHPQARYVQVLREEQALRCSQLIGSKLGESWKSVMPRCGRRPRARSQHRSSPRSKKSGESLPNSRQLTRRENSSSKMLLPYPSSRAPTRGSTRQLWTPAFCWRKQREGCWRAPCRLWGRRGHVLVALGRSNPQRAAAMLLAAGHSRHTRPDGAVEDAEDAYMDGTLNNEELEQVFECVGGAEDNGLLERVKREA